MPTAMSIVSGFSTDDDVTYLDNVTIKYDKNGTWVWGRRDNLSDALHALEVDSLSSVILTTSDYVTIKYDASRSWLWGKRYDLGSASYGLTVDPQSNVYVTGDSNDDCVTIKYDNGGVWQWGSRYDGPD